MLVCYSNHFAVVTVIFFKKHTMVKKKKCYTVEEALHMFQNIDEAESKDD